MLSASSRSNSPFPWDHLDTLYTLACVLVGSDRAPALLLQVARNSDPSSSSPPETVPEWTRALLQEAQNAGSPRDDVPNSSVPNHDPDSSDASDPLRLAAAQQLLEDTSLIALAACPPEVRVRLVLDALSRENASSLVSGATEKSHIPDTTEAWRAFRTELRAILSASELSLVTEALDESALRRSIRNVVSNQFPSVPGSLQPQIQSELQTSTPPDNTETPEESVPFLEGLPTRLTPRRLLLTLLGGIVILVTAVGVSYVPAFSPSSDSSRPTLTGYSASRAGTLEATVQTTSPKEAHTYVDSTFNRRVTVPTLTGSRLSGVTHLHPDEETRVPVFLYNEGAARIAVFAYNYAVLQRMQKTATLGVSARRALGKSRHLVAGTADSERGILWRDRDDIFVAVAPSMPLDSLRKHLRLDD